MRPQTGFRVLLRAPVDEPLRCWGYGWGTRPAPSRTRTARSRGTRRRARTS